MRRFTTAVRCGTPHNCISRHVAPALPSGWLSNNFVDRQQEGAVAPINSHTEVDAAAAGTNRSVQVQATSMRIRDLSIERPAIIAYLRNIAPEKQEIALLHAIEVGITEMTARRERFQH